MGLSTKNRIVKNGVQTPQLVSVDGLSVANTENLASLSDTIDTPPTVSGDISTDVNAVMRSLLDALAGEGLIDDQTTD